MNKLRVQVITQDGVIDVRIYRGDQPLCGRTWRITGSGYRADEPGTLGDDLKALATAEAPEEDLDDFDEAVGNAVGAVFDMLRLTGEILA